MRRGVSMVRLECIGENENTFKFYEIATEDDLIDQACLVVRWGRIGKAGRQRIHAGGNVDEMQKMARKLEEKKRRNGYHAPSFPCEMKG